MGKKGAYGDQMSIKLGAIARAKHRLALAHPEEFKKYYEEEYILKSARFNEWASVVAEINRVKHE